MGEYINGVPQSGSVEDAAYGAGWDGDTLNAPSQNAVYDKIESMGGAAMGAWGASAEITIDTDGKATLTGEGYFTIDTFDDAASDDLVEIAGLAVGDEAILTPENGARTVVVKHDGAKIFLANGADFTMDNINDLIGVQCISAGVCRETRRVSIGG